MNRLSLAELKAQKGSVIANLEAIKGGNAGDCHNGSCLNLPQANVTPHAPATVSQKNCDPCASTARNEQSNGLIYLICVISNLF